MTGLNDDGAAPPTDALVLRLAVVDAEDLAVVSAHLQDSEVVAPDMGYLPKSKRFALVVSRFDWTQALAGRFERCRTGLHFERVLGVATTGLDLADADAVLHLLAISFRPGAAPSGHVLLAFAGGGAVRLTVECLEAELRDLGPRWAVDAKPLSRLDAVGTAAV